MKPNKPAGTASSGSQRLQPEDSNVRKKNNKAPVLEPFLPNAETQYKPDSINLKKADIKPANSSRLHQLSDWAYKQLIIIRDTVAGIIPKGLKSVAHDLKDLFAVRTYGSRYEKGIPDKDLHLFHTPRLIVVRGMGVNRFYHAMLSFGDPMSKDSRFVQINAMHAHPEVLNQKEFIDFLEKEGGEIKYVYQPLETERSASPETLTTANKYLQRLSGRKYRWLPTSNCLTFCLRYFRKAGYSTKGLGGVLDIPKLDVVGKRTRAKNKKLASLRSEFAQNKPHNIQSRQPPPDIGEDSL